MDVQIIMGNGSVAMMWNSTENVFAFQIIEPLPVGTPLTGDEKMLALIELRLSLSDAEEIRLGLLGDEARGHDSIEITMNDRSIVTTVSIYFETPESKIMFCNALEQYVAGNEGESDGTYH